MASELHAQQAALSAALALEAEAAQKASAALKAGGDEEEAAGEPRADELGFDELAGAEAKRQEAAIAVKQRETKNNNKTRTSFCECVRMRGVD